MKDSGIPWIGEIPEHWQLFLTSTLFHEHKEKNNGLKNTNLLSLSYGKIKRKDINTNEGLLPQSFETYNVIAKDDIVFRLTDLQNDKKSLRTGLCLEDGIITSAYLTLRKNTDLNSSFFHYLYHVYDLCKVFYGLGDGVRQGMNYDDIRRIIVFSPPLEEQQRIADFLDQKCGEIDEMVSLQEKIIEELKAYKQAIITEATTHGLNPNATMKPSGIEWIGEIPMEWEVRKCGRIFKENVRPPKGGDTSLSLSQADGLIPTSEMKEKAMLTSTYEGWKRVLVNDLVLNRFKAHLGVLFASKYVGMVSFHYGVYEPLVELVPKYYEYLFHSHQYKLILAGASNGMVVGLQNLSNSNFYKVFCLFPPLSEQQQIAEFLDQKCADIDSLVAIKQQKIEELKDYKKSIIYEYITGKKEVAK